MVSINRVTKVVKGGRILGFAALTVVGDGDGGSAWARASPAKCRSRAEGDGRGASQDGQGQPQERHPAAHGDRPHGASSVMMQPAPEGTGIIAGGPMRACSK
jgi:small subunit ribosomal protein S5